MNKVLYLASGSFARARILKESLIPFIVHKHFSQEEACIKFEPGVDKVDFVAKIAEHKASTVILPEDARSYNEVFVLVADTLVFANDGKSSNEFISKPVDRADAVRMLKLFQKTAMSVVTVAVVQKVVFEGGLWKVVESETIKDVSECWWQVPDDEIDFYLDNEPRWMAYSSSATLCGIGAQYTRLINGCYSSIIGLPIFKVREVLTKMGYLSKRGVVNEGNQS